ncbi:Hypothetical predicted protein [Pelobates cultripes]|uniref:Uncharacterized protein n=1 Tax=Pelobates cultripes TaxID=61616 RepID=A0AAD1R788_PELCU|nr:Hypothetical predicted protein [Pelobates cultripes]
MPAPEEQPRDIICCLENYQLKEDILCMARRMGTIRFESQNVSIYQDLSRYTLQARRALHPVTSALQQAGILYRWGYPFSLSARHGPDQVTSQVSFELWAYHRSKYQTGWRDHFSNHRLDRSNHADQTRVLKGPCNSTAETGTQAQQGVSRSTN